LDVGERGLPAIAEQARKAIYNWLQYHPLAIPRQRDTGMVTVAKNKGLSLTPSLAAPRPFLTPPQPPPRLLPGGPGVGATFLEGGPASSPLGSLTGSGMVSSRSTTHIPHAQERGTEVEGSSESEEETSRAAMRPTPSLVGECVPGRIES
jgi:hypothetical protein